MNISNEEYGELAKKRSHGSKLYKTVPMAFLVGGLICTLGEVLLKKFGEDCAEVATVEKGAKLEGRNMSMFLSPKSTK